MIHFNFEQGSDLWLACRAGKITASRCKDARDFKLPTKAKKEAGATRGDPSAKMIGYAAQVAVERIAGKPIDQQFENWQMREGHMQEPEARAAYEELTGNLVEEVGALATDDSRYLYSPDGLVGDDGLIEIKSLFSAERIVNIVGNGDISDFADQCNFGLWLTGRKWIDLVLWAPALAPIGLDMTIIRIERNDDAIEALEADMISFAKVVYEFEESLRAKAAAKAAIEAMANASAPGDEVLILELESEPEIDLIEPAAPAAIVQAAIEMRDKQLERDSITSAPTLKLGQIAERLGFTLSANFLDSLGFKPAATEKGAKLFHEQDFQRMCAVLVRHIQHVAQGVTA